MSYPSDLYDKEHLKVRYLAAGIIAIPNDKLPADFHEMTVRQLWDWLGEYWDGLDISDIMGGLLLEDFPGQPRPAMVERFDPEVDDYETLAASNEWEGYWDDPAPEELSDTRPWAEKAIVSRP